MSPSSGDSRREADHFGRTGASFQIIGPTYHLVFGYSPTRLVRRNTIAVQSDEAIASSLGSVTKRRMNMRKSRIVFLTGITILIAAATLFTGGNSSLAQNKLPKSIHIQAQAMGTSTQLGKNFSITAIINELSPPEDQKVLLEAFQSKGN